MPSLNQFKSDLYDYSFPHAMGFVSAFIAVSASILIIKAFSSRL